jgi:hypothetical protein
MNTATPAPTPFDAAIEGVTALENEFAFKELDLNDRCDADAGEAAVAQVLVGSTILLFCAHHARANADLFNEFPHSVPDEASQPMTYRRAAELGAPASRSQGDEHA